MIWSSSKMVNTAAEENVKELVTDAVTSIVRTELNFTKNITVHGTISITFDDHAPLVVGVNKVINKIPEKERSTVPLSEARIPPFQISPESELVPIPISPSPTMPSASSDHQERVTPTTYQSKSTTINAPESVNHAETTSEQLEPLNLSMKQYTNYRTPVSSSFVEQRDESPVPQAPGSNQQVGVS